MNMRKLFFALIALAVGFMACEQPINEEPNLPKLTIRNESSFELTDIKFSGFLFAIPDSTELPPSEQATKQLTADHLNQSGYIMLTRKDIGINLRTAQVLTIDGDNCTFTFIDFTPVEEMGNNGNRGILSTIDFESEIVLAYDDGLNIVKNDTVDAGEGFINEIKQLSFTIKKTGKGKLSLTGAGPIKSDSENFTVVQPENSTLDMNEILDFTVNFRPTEIKNYTSVITIVSDSAKDDFTFRITAKGVAPKPIATVLYNNAKITQNGTIDIGKIGLLKTGTLSIMLRNDGNEVLALDTAGITITGTNANDFSLATQPGTNIAVGSQTTFTIKVIPTKFGVNDTILTIPTNDDLRNPILINLKVTGILEAPLTTVTAKSISSIDISWNSIGGAASYKIYRSATSGGTFTQIATQTTTLDETTESYTDTGLAPATAYYYKVSAAASNGEEGTQSVTRAAYTLMTAPTLADITVMEYESLNNGKLPNCKHGIKLTWNNAPGISYYTVYRSTNPASDFIAVKSNIYNKTSYDDFGLASESTYYYKLTGLIYNSNTGDFYEVTSSAVVSYLTRTALPVLSGKSSSSIQVQWNSIAGADSYNIYRMTDSTSLKIGSTSGDTTKFTDTGLTSGTYYYYYISALIDGVEKRSRTAVMVTAPRAPVGIYLEEAYWTGGEFHINIRWANSPYAAEYKLYRATSASGPYSDTGARIYTEHTSVAQSEGRDIVNTVTTYYYKVTAINDGGESDFSSVISVTVANPNQ